MYIKYKELLNKYDIDVKGILHVGAHHAEEYKDYTRNGCDKDKIIWIEGNEGLCKRLKIPNVFNYVVGDENDKEVQFNIANNGQSSSILELGKHKELYPHISYTRKKKRKTCRIDKIYETEKVPKDFANFLNLDIQGAELLALRGMGELLQQFDYIYTEVNYSYIYEGCCLIGELDDFLKGFNFSRTITHWSKGSRYEGEDPVGVDANFGHEWGDAFYIKNKA